MNKFKAIYTLVLSLLAVLKVHLAKRRHVTTYTLKYVNRTCRPDGNETPHAMSPRQKDRELTRNNDEE